jgi:CBS domain-containing protein
LGSGRRSLIVKENDRVTGLLTLHNVKAVPATEWLSTKASQVMVPIEKIKRISPNAELTDALGEMDRDGVNQLPVMVDNDIQGILGRDDVISTVRNLSEFSHH